MRPAVYLCRRNQSSQPTRSGLRSRGKEVVSLSRARRVLRCRCRPGERATPSAGSGRPDPRLLLPEQGSASRQCCWRGTAVTPSRDAARSHSRGRNRGDGGCGTGPLAHYRLAPPGREITLFANAIARRDAGSRQKRSSPSLEHGNAIACRRRGRLVFTVVRVPTSVCGGPSLLRDRLASGLLLRAAQDLRGWSLWPGWLGR